MVAIELVGLTSALLQLGGVFAKGSFLGVDDGDFERVLRSGDGFLGVW